MAKKKVRFILGCDPSGNFTEGKGHTGFALFDKQEDKFLDVFEVDAKDFNSIVEYWDAVVKAIEQYIGVYDFVFSVEDYLIYYHKAISQAFSRVETCRLLGILQMYCWWQKIPYFTRAAKYAKQIWTDEALLAEGYLAKLGRCYALAGTHQLLTEHKRDAMRHALYCAYTDLKDD